MRSLALIIPVLLSGCYSCSPSVCGPGWGSGQYGSCVDSQYIAPPLIGTHQHDRPTLAERRQQRELSRWYRDLNDSPRGRGGRGSSCPHCGSRLTRQSQHAFSNGFYGDEYYGDQMVYDGFYDGQVIDGQVIDGGTMGGYCSECESNHGGSYPMLMDGMPTYGNVESFEGTPSPSPVPSGPPQEPTRSNNSTPTDEDDVAPELPPLTANEYYFPPGNTITTTSQPPALTAPRDLQPVSVDQSLFVPPRVE